MGRRTVKNILNGLSKFFKPEWLKVGLWLGLSLLAVFFYSYREHTSKVTWFELHGWPFTSLTLEGCSQSWFCITDIQVSHPGAFAVDCVFWYVWACVLIEIRNLCTCTENIPVRRVPTENGGEKIIF
jgi:hypothetical protein